MPSLLPIQPFKSFVLVLSSLFVFGCSSNKANQENNDTLASKSTSAFVSKNESFETFFKKFQSDSVFQISRVAFPLKIAVKEDDGDFGKFVDREKWRFTGIITGKVGNGIIKTTRITANEYKVQCQVEDTGVELDYHFINKNGKWQLNLVEDYSD